MSAAVSTTFGAAEGAIVEHAPAFGLAVLVALAGAFFGAHGEGFADFRRRLVESLLHGGKVPLGGGEVKGVLSADVMHTVVRQFVSVMQDLKGAIDMGGGTL